MHLQNQPNERYGLGLEERVHLDRFCSGQGGFKSALHVVPGKFLGSSLARGVERMMITRYRPMQPCSQMPSKCDGSPSNVLCLYPQHVTGCAFRAGRAAQDGGIYDALMNIVNSESHDFRSRNS